MKKKIVVLLLLMAMSVFVISGCTTEQPTTDDSATEESTPAEEPAGDAADQADADSSAEPPSIGITIQSLENAYWAGVFGEVEKILKDEGWKYTIVGCNDNSATQIEQIEGFITDKVDLIMVHPSDPTAVEDYLKQAMDAGIKVMVWDDKCENSDLNWVLDNTKLGYEIGGAAAAFVNEHFTSDNKVQVAMMNYPQTPILLERENGIKSALEEQAAGLYEIVAEQPAIDAAAAQTNMETILQANPDVKIVCSIGAGGDIGANEAFLVKYKNEIPEDVGIFSADATQQQLEAIVKGEASRASVGFEGSNLKTAQAVTALYNKLVKGEEITGEDFDGHNLYRPLLVIDANNAQEYLDDYNN
ncbi:MAG: sugar ABC transporter substrate-binding protein [Clostridiales Family XIII bacterium]|jgi:ribose transport system substrate-binding protein|nr:sugar ABC transporter substrate-binding protein [Clostridiales Family XIII bacterium]